MTVTLTCKELIEFIGRYVADALDTETRKRFDQHLEICPECVDYLDSYRKTIQLGRDALLEGGEAPPAPMPDDLVEAILEATGKKPS